MRSSAARLVMSHFDRAPTQRFFHTFRAAAIAGLLWVLTPAVLWAQTDAITVAYHQGKAPVAPDAITVLGPDLFGDRINLFNGAFAFEQTDFELPGNNALPVAIVREYAPRMWSVRGAMADWDLNTPRIQGTFADPEGWVPAFGSAASRCSAFAAPPTVTRGNYVEENALSAVTKWVSSAVKSITKQGAGATPNALVGTGPADFSPWEYWGGTNLVVPGHGSTFGFQAFDTPSEDNIASATLPENVTLSIVRDVFGKATSITRSGYWGSTPVSSTRSYVYDNYERLCRTVEPETGTTVQDYDAANNLAWRASGLSVSTLCGPAGVPVSARISYSYDLRNRLLGTTFGEAINPAMVRTYTDDGLLKTIASAGWTWTYGYNNRRVLSAEVASGASSSYSFVRGVDGNGNQATQGYPDGTVVNYLPNALGQPTQASGYASVVSWHPNPALAGYTPATTNIVHYNTQNSRGFPEQWVDTGVVNDVYRYDLNANVTSITDQQEGGLTSRSMGYDGLDRLFIASGIWGASALGYDGLDNLRTSTVGSRTAVAGLDLATNRLTSLTVNGVGQTYLYDANGNLTQRGSQGFVFDLGNRLASATGKASYLYDGHGRRVWIAYADASTKLQLYSQSGKLLWSQYSTQGNTRHIYLGERLIAETNSATGTSYSHTDALGSPVARSNSIGQITARTRYEPYGATAAGTNPTGIGFTGHVNDADTGLVYMQQRYYDPIAGRFLSVDPVVTDTKTGERFNRYEYAQSNPFKHVDPDGRAPKSAAEILSENGGGGFGMGGGGGGGGSGGILGGSGALRAASNAGDIGKSAAGALPQMKGMGASERAKALGDTGFQQTKVSSGAGKNETWSHADGSQVRVHPYGDQAQGAHKSGNNAHIHKQDPQGNQLNDRGAPSIDKSQTHIGLPNPKDFEAVRGRQNGS